MNENTVAIIAYLNALCISIVAWLLFVTMCSRTAIIVVAIIYTIILISSFLEAVKETDFKVGAILFGWVLVTPGNAAVILIVAIYLSIRKLKGVENGE